VGERDSPGLERGKQIEAGGQCVVEVNQVCGGGAKRGLEGREFCSETG